MVLTVLMTQSGLADVLLMSPNMVLTVLMTQSGLADVLLISPNVILRFMFVIIDGQQHCCNDNK